MRAWRVVVPLVACVASAFAYGFAAARRQLWPAGAIDAAAIRWETPAEPAVATQAEGGAPRNGSWNIDRRRGRAPLDPESVQKLQSIGYLAGYKPAPGVESVTMWKRDATRDGLNLYTSGHAAEATLMTMDGHVVRTWRYPYERAFPNQPALPSTPAGREHWRRVRLLPDGGLLAIYEGQGLIRLDRDSKLAWALPIGAHHDLDVRDDGSILVLTREVTLREDVHETEPILEDFITEIRPDGRVIDSLSIVDAFLHSDYAACMRKGPQYGDLFHTNTLHILDGANEKRLPAFRRGNILISSPHMDTVAIVDPRERRVVWALSGLWHFQHEPVLLPGGTLLVLDNQSQAGRSRVLEIDPLTQRVMWSFEGDAGHPFFTQFNGSVQRLANGNTLIVESDGGRAFEVDRQGRTVWEFYNPHRAGARGELIASLFDLVRIEPS
jgi:hypothetical protein